MPDQSSAAREHELLRQIAEPLDSLPEDPVRVTAEVEFPTALRGYDRLAVDAYVRRTSRLVAELQARTSPHAAIRRALERVGEEVSGILQRAHETAAEITAQSRREAEERLEVARREAEQIVAGAHERVKALDADTDRIWEERERILADVRELANQLAELVDSATARLPGPTAVAEDLGGERASAAVERAPFDVEEEGREPEPDANEQEGAAFAAFEEADREPSGDFGEEQGEGRSSPSQGTGAILGEEQGQRTRPFDAQELEELGVERFDEDEEEAQELEYDELGSEQPTIVVGPPSAAGGAGEEPADRPSREEETSETEPTETQPPQGLREAAAPGPARAPFDFEAEAGSLPGVPDPPGGGIAARENLGARPTV